jgi:hypothetical protein
MRAPGQSAEHAGSFWGRPLGALAVMGLCIAVLPGCANFKAASEFATQTTKLTTVVKTEFSQLEALCTQQGEIAIVVANRSDEAPLDDCKQYKAAQGRLADVTVAVLDGYGKALSGLADDKSFDLSSDIKNIGDKLQGLKDKDGQALVNVKEVGALTKLADLLFDLVANEKRSAAIERMVQEVPDLKITGQLLKSFFIDSADAPAGRSKAPYTNFVTIIDGASTSTERLLAGPALRTAEPIRTAELLRGVRARKQLLQARQNTGPQSVPAKIGAAIDSWQDALDTFATDALKPDPKALYSRLKVLQEKASAAKDAVEGKSE